MAEQQRHHHHHHHHKDQSDLFKEHQLRAARRKKTIGRALYILACLLSVAIVAAVAWLYTHE